MSSFPNGRPAHEQPRWRQDFPIDWPQDQYVSRRDLLKFFVVISAGFSIGQMWIGWSASRANAVGAGRKLIGKTGDLAVGQSLLFTYPGEHDRCLLVRTGESELVAFSQKCTHLACAVVPEPQHNRFHCPCHAGYFDIRTGQPIAGPPRRPLPRIDLEVTGEEIYATGVSLEAQG
jgi:nitrite reductase/ring-hydroxylating ferredoxin subunit